MRLISDWVDVRLKQGGELFFSRMIEKKTTIILETAVDHSPAALTPPEIR